MSIYNFYAGYLRFVSENTPPDTPEIQDMMAELNYIAKILDNNSTFTVEENKLRITSRALAGVAGFLQQHILPEIIEAENTSGELQIRWVIDASMNIMSNLMVHAELANNCDEFVAVLPEPPVIL
jgi:hypothetical protein